MRTSPSGAALALICLSGTAWASSCARADAAVLNSLGDQFAQDFFSCYDTAQANVTASCFGGLVSLQSAACTTCITSVAQCVQNACSAFCVPPHFPSSCSQCASGNCQSTLDGCSGSSASFISCSTLLCNEPTWVLPVIIAGSVVGAGLLAVAVLALFRRCNSDDAEAVKCCAVCRDAECGGPGFTCCSGEEGCLAGCWNFITLKDPEAVRFDKEQRKREERMARFREKAASDRRTAEASTSTPVKASFDFPPDDEDNFSFSSPIGTMVRDEVAAPPTHREHEEEEEDFSPRSQTVVEHNIRVSKLPKEFRQSFSPGLTPEQLFGADTLRMMEQANSKAVPNAVVASHKALKMMGVNEAEVQKPYSETVQERVQRMARAAAVSSGASVGGSLVGVGQQVAEASALKQREAEQRAQERRRREELRKEEARIRAEIEAANKQEKAETELRNSQRLSKREAARLSGALADRKNKSQAKSKLAQFVATQGDDVV